LQKLPDHWELRKETNVATTGGNDHRLSEKAAQQDSSKAIWINVVGINDVKVKSLLDLSYCWQH
jgi:hypothetical protein